MAISANVLRADLTRALPKARRESVHVNGSVSILESDADLAQSIARMLRAEGFAARAWTSAREFIAQAEPPLSGCLIANASMPDMTGLELQREVGARQWPLPVILLTAADDIKTVVRGMKAGAINCLPKPVQRRELLEAVREALSESLVVRAQRTAQLRVQQMLERLTPREREVLDLAVTGLLVKQIAARLGTAEKTVKTHKGRLMRKMQVRSTLSLVQLMITAGLSPLAPVGEWVGELPAPSGSAQRPRPSTSAIGGAAAGTALR